MGKLALLGSGETAPGMTKIHREILKDLDPQGAVNLNTPYGFQENVPQMTAKLVEYFSTSLHIPLRTLDFISFDRASELERVAFKKGVRDSSYVFAGPGSPTYALKQWKPLELETDLSQVIANGGTVCFASAAVLTLGAFTAPIYEIYKVGEEPYWQNGLNLMASLGLNCVTIPHFDNKEGSNYDTSCCYLGMRRLESLESELPDGVATLGIDEHTALIIDLDSRTMDVRGRSNAYWRLNGEVRVLENGSSTPISNLSSALEVAITLPSDRTSQQEQRVETPEYLAHVAAAGGPDSLVALAQLIKLAKTGGDGFIDPTPLVEGILKARVNAREHRDFALADELREVLVASDIEINDTPAGSTWNLRRTGN